MSCQNSPRDPTPRRQVERCIKPAFLLTDCNTLQALVEKVQKRIRQTLYARGAGTVVAINSRREVYLLMAGEARTERFITDNYDWVMGIYAEQPMGGGNAAVPDLELLADDIRFHLPADALIDEPVPSGKPGPVQLELEFPPLHEIPIAA